jgi:rhamnopyranosyl-N-acetylglucosaminyl-diphospho-decaprenol beta-1,3/1,4-galactofuranosyltransferase
VTERGEVAHDRVLAIVLTYEAPESRAAALRALAEQTSPPDAVLVVDNGGGANVPAVLSRPTGGRDVPTTLLRMSANSVPQAATRSGSPRSSTTARSAISPMDGSWTKTSPRPRRPCAAARPRARGILWGGVPDLDQRGVRPHRELPGVVRRAPRPRHCRPAGVPRAELFWWVEDTEYFHHRLPRVGVVALRADADVVRHRPVWRGAGRQPWKTYCEVRNTVYYRTGVQDPTPQRLLSLASSVTPLLGDAVLRSPRRSKLRMFAWGLSDGARGRLGKRVDPVAPRGRHAAGSPAPPLGGSLS